MNTASHTLLERLPDELFLQIFSHFDAVDLFRGWSSLNQRITSILNDIPLSIDMSSWKNDDENFHLFDQLSSKLIRLYTPWAHPNIDFTRLPKLCSLTIRSPSQLEIAAMSALPHLKFLSCTEDQPLFDALFSDNVHGYFPSLRTCDLVDSQSDLRTSHQPNNTLRSLSLIQCSISQCDRLFTLLPQLQHLKINDLGRAYWHPSMLSTHQLLTYLQLGFTSMFNWIDLGILLQATPQLQRLHIYGTQTEFDLEAFGDNILAKRTPQLKLFECELEVLSPPDENIESRKASTFLQSIKCHIKIIRPYFTLD